jgi:hypothetical protein
MQIADSVPLQPDNDPEKESFVATVPDPLNATWPDDGILIEPEILNVPDPNR